MLDNGYVYLAATRLSLYRSSEDWAMVIEVFGFSPRSGVPDTHIYSFASSLAHRQPPANFASRKGYDNYIANNPNNESRFIYPMTEGPWIDEQNTEFVAVEANRIQVRSEDIRIPSFDEYKQYGIALAESPRVHIFELCRYLAEISRKALLATPEEKRINVPAELEQIMELDEWHHPNVVALEHPSETETFRQLAEVLATGNVGLYRPSESPNTHWRNWPDGGTL